MKNSLLPFLQHNGILWIESLQIILLVKTTAGVRAHMCQAFYKETYIIIPFNPLNVSRCHPHFHCTDEDTRHREVKEHVQSHTGNKCQNWDLNPKQSDSRAYVLNGLNILSCVAGRGDFWIWKVFYLFCLFLCAWEVPWFMMLSSARKESPGFGGGLAVSSSHILRVLSGDTPSLVQRPVSRAFGSRAEVLLLACWTLTSFLSLKRNTKRSLTRFPGAFWDTMSWDQISSVLHAFKICFRPFENTKGAYFPLFLAFILLLH